MSIRYFERVIVGLALAPVDRDLLQYARMLNDLGQGKTRFTFIHALPAETRAKIPSVTAVSEARSAVRAVVADVFGPADGHEMRVMNENLVDALLGEAADGGADLILVGHRRNSRGRRSLSRRLAIKAPCSVWMVPEGSPARISRVVTAVDMSQPSALALSFGTLVANRAGLDQCTVLHVLTPSIIGYEKEERAVVTSAMTEFLAPVDVHGVNVKIRLEESGSVAGAVKALTEDGHDLVVIGTRGRSPSAAVLLGSESEHVLTESPVPVLITKLPGERIGVLKALLERDFKFQYKPHFG